MGGTCWVLSFPYALCRVTDRWTGSPDSFLHGQHGPDAWDTLAVETLMYKVMK